MCESRYATSGNTLNPDLELVASNSRQGFSRLKSRSLFVSVSLSFSLFSQCVGVSYTLFLINVRSSSAPLLHQLYTDGVWNRPRSLHPIDVGDLYTKCMCVCLCLCSAVQNIHNSVYIYLCVYRVSRKNCILAKKTWRTLGEETRVTNAPRSSVTSGVFAVYS